MKTWAKKENCGIPVGKALLEEQSLLSNIFIVDDQMKFKQANMLVYTGISELNDIIYDENYPDYCKLDLLFDESKIGIFKKDKYPILFNIHGGGWIAGDKSYRRGYCMHFANQGFFVININYCMTKKHPFPIPVQNVATAIDWVYDNKDKYNLDIDNLTITGDSAGGHLSAMALAAQASEELRERLSISKPKIEIKKAILHSSVLYFDTANFYIPIVRTMPRELIGVMRRKDYKNYEYANEVSPVKYLEPNGPKILIVTGRTDYFTKYHNFALAKHLSEIKADYRHLHYKTLFNSFHCFHLKIWMPGANKACLESLKFAMEDLVENKEDLDKVLSYKDYKKQLVKG